MSQLSIFDPPPERRRRSSAEEHQTRMTQRALAVIRNVFLVAQPLRPEAETVLSALRAESSDYCVCCGYKRKAPTGENRGAFDPDLVAQVAQNRQRDGDDGDITKRKGQLVRILGALWDARARGLTDEELTTQARVFRLSAAAARANLAAGGWVKSKGLAKRPSRQGSPMTVWTLTEEAIERLETWGWS